MTTARRATTPTTTRIASTGQSQGLDRLASMTSASYGLPERFNLRVPYVLPRTRPHRPLVSMPAEHIGLRVRVNGYAGKMSPGGRTRAHPGTTSKAAGRLSSREVTPRRLRGTDKYFPMDSGVDETQQEGTAGASFAVASERKVANLFAVEDLDGLSEGSCDT